MRVRVWYSSVAQYKVRIHLLGSNVDDELKELRRENSFLNNLVKRLVLDEVEQPPSGLGFRKQIAEKQPTVLKLSNNIIARKCYYKFEMYTTLFNLFQIP